MAKRGLRVIKQSNTGLNTKFKDRNGNVFTRGEFIKHKELQKRYDVHIVNPKNKPKYVRSNPNRSKGDNLE